MSKTAVTPQLPWHRVGVLLCAMVLLVGSFADLTVWDDRWNTVAVWACAWLSVCAGLFAVIGSRNSARCWIVWPLVGIAELASFGAVSPSASVLVTGLLTVLLVYSGLTQPPGRSLCLIPLALAAWWSITNMPFNQAAVQLSLAAVTFTVAAELPAILLRRLSAQQLALTEMVGLDPLTGVLNRHRLQENLDAMAGGAAVVMLDLDHFKTYNDEHGHLAGDQVLVDFAAMLRRSCRSRDLVIRFGGEEFLVVLQDTDVQGAGLAADRWSLEWHLHPSGVTFSGGITDLDGTGALHRVDAALYQAKAAGRARFVTWVSTAVGPAGDESQRIPLVLPGFNGATDDQRVIEQRQQSPTHPPTAPVCNQPAAIE